LFETLQGIEWKKERENRERLNHNLKRKKREREGERDCIWVLFESSIMWCLSVRSFVHPNRMFSLITKFATFISSHPISTQLSSAQLWLKKILWLEKHVWRVDGPKVNQTDVTRTQKNKQKDIKTKHFIRRKNLLTF
jgi:hypothetical protein